MEGCINRLPAKYAEPSTCRKIQNMDIIEISLDLLPGETVKYNFDNMIASTDLGPSVNTLYNAQT